MIFSSANAIEREMKIRANHKGTNLLSRLWEEWLYPSNPDYKLTFYVPEYLHLRAISFCEDVQWEIEEEFDVGELAYSLYVDFIRYTQRTNDLDSLFKRLQVREVAPLHFNPYQTSEASEGVLFEEIRGFEKVTASIPHKLVLKGEFILRDMLEIYDHSYTVENILEIVFYSFMNDYRRGLILNPITKIKQYVEEAI